MNNKFKLRVNLLNSFWFTYGKPLRFLKVIPAKVYGSWRILFTVQWYHICTYIYVCIYVDGNKTSTHFPKKKQKNTKCNEKYKITTKTNNNKEIVKNYVRIIKTVNQQDGKMVKGASMN